ncbi:MAG: hypothetical protein SPL63_01900 [Roseburia faecis]|nr:hypothetical protein [Lachnospiraceae bacterium]MDY6278859.1 hypothetical protein [Roseburia faecis]MDY6362195.1 hypothetical protein [Lachnospiraceae bacterium]
MLALQGYYDGTMVRTLEKINAKKNQKLIITVLDEFMDESISKEEKNQQEEYWLNMRTRSCVKESSTLGKRR